MIKKKIFINKNLFKNKIVVSPMCQYSSDDGCPSKWHYHHLKNLIMSGAGSLVIESTAVSKIGKITHKDLCLYNQKHLYGHRRLVKSLKKIKNIPIVIQISHSGRKGSAEIPWLKKNCALSKKNRWTTIAPSALNRSSEWPKPKEMSKKEIKTVINDFKKTAKFAYSAGYDGIEIHMAHGYLIHQFCSRISNIRKDEYGLTNINNFKFALEILKQINKIKPKNKIIGARVTGDDHVRGGIKLNNSIELIKQLKKNGLDYVCVSSGGILPKTGMKFKKGFRIQMASMIKKICKIKTRTSGLIDDVSTIKKAFSKNLDFVALGRILIKRKYFLYEEGLLKEKEIEKQYKFCL